MNERWSSVELGKVLRLDLDKVAIDNATSYPMVGVLSFGRGLFVREPVENGNTSYRVFYKLKADHIVMSQLFGWEGALALSSKEFAGKYLSPQFPTFLCEESKLDRHFLGWFMRRPAFWEELGSRATGMGDRRRTLNPEALLACKIPLPPLEEQRRIVARIEQTAALIEHANTARDDAIDGAAKFLSIFSGRVFDKACERYGTKRLDDLCIQITDGTHKTPRYVESGVPFLSVKDITSGTILFSKVRYITPEEHKELQRRCKPERGDVLLTKVGTTGFAKVIDVDQEFSIFVSLALLKLDKKVLDPRFVEYMLNSVRLREFSAAGTRGVGNKNLVLKFIRDFPMPIPPLPEQERMVAELDRFKQQLAELKQLQDETDAELDALIPSILSRAFSGEL